MPFMSLQAEPVMILADRCRAVADDLRKMVEIVGDETERRMNDRALTVFYALYVGKVVVDSLAILQDDTLQIQEFVAKFRVTYVNPRFGGTRLDDFQVQQAALIQRKRAAMERHVDHHHVRRQTVHPLRLVDMLPQNDEKVLEGGPSSTWLP